MKVKHFLEMVRLLNTQGIMDPSAAPDLRAHKPAELDAILSGVINCQPIVFEPSGKGIHEVPHNADLRLDAPFPVFSIEMSSGPITSARPGEDDLNIWCLICEEYAPNDFYTLALINSSFNSTKRVFMYSSKCLVKEMLKRLNTEVTGHENVRHAIKLKTKTHGKIKQRIRRIVHVMPKKVAEVRKTEVGGKIDFSHRFWVRGHWRSLGPGKIGKDRLGDYCVQGATWVSEFTKGDEELPLINKTRFVKGGGK